MYRGDCIDGLQFNDYQVFDKEVDAIAEIKCDPAIHDWKSDLGGRLNASGIEFKSKTCRVSAFMEPCSELRVDLHGGSEDGMAYLLSAQAMQGNRSHAAVVTATDIVSQVTHHTQ